MFNLYVLFGNTGLPHEQTSETDETDESGESRVCLEQYSFLKLTAWHHGRNNVHIRRSTARVNFEHVLE